MSVKSVLEKYGLKARRELGQCFLTDRSAIETIAACAVAGPEKAIVEIGPGLGALTEVLLEYERDVIAIEKDPGFIDVLNDRFQSRPNFKLLHADARKTVFGDLSAPHRPAVVGNLPYSITSPLLLAFLAQRASIGRTTIMIQREVAERLLADPGSKDYGSLTVLFRLHADIERVLEVDREAFWPSPKVDSTVLLIEWLDRPAAEVESLDDFEAFLRAAFGQRRKTLRNALSKLVPKEHLEGIEADSGVDLGRRAETLTVSEFARLSSAWSRARRGPHDRPSHS